MNFVIDIYYSSFQQTIDVGGQEGLTDVFTNLK